MNSQLIIIFALLLASFRGISARRSRGNRNRTESHSEAMSNPRQKRLFSLFNIVKFKNEACTAVSDSSLTGTCYSIDDCMSRSGSTDGNCAAGFGVCCIFTKSDCGGSISHNCTYIQNEGYPGSTANTQTCMYSFDRICPDLCQIRLDFDAFTIAQPPTAGANIGDCSSSGDVLTVTSPTGANPPALCGDLSNQHMFFEATGTGSAGMLSLALNAAGAINRRWRIKTTFYSCNSRNRAPDDCVQFFTARSGTIQSYNFPNAVIENQLYESCIRQEMGFCGIQFTQSPSTAAIDTFMLDRGPGIADRASTTCPVTYVLIESDDLAGSRVCGDVFSSVDGDQTPGAILSDVLPFRLGVFADDTITSSLTGFSLEYAQVPC